ncbi:hypothetical protein CBOM_04412 [Ceraceosorus bombacis]|uniref:Uncharacterized protein n=1 Tax=Ceraceosorus bombacis TaxID=401625 RepID=A0A0P1BNN9_9BASI|nr:hypothetical protein CBOM_04412 [Ceraceosorus bombacis]
MCEADADAPPITRADKRRRQASKREQVKLRKEMAEHEVLDAAVCWDNIAQAEPSVKHDK